jgi:hypothetical protein
MTGNSQDPKMEANDYSDPCLLPSKFAKKMQIWPQIRYEGYQKLKDLTLSSNSLEKLQKCFAKNSQRPRTEN